MKKAIQALRKPLEKIPRQREGTIDYTGTLRDPASAGSSRQYSQCLFGRQGDQISRQLEAQLYSTIILEEEELMIGEVEDDLFEISLYKRMYDYSTRKPDLPHVSEYRLHRAARAKDCEPVRVAAPYVPEHPVLDWSAAASAVERDVFEESLVLAGTCFTACQLGQHGLVADTAMLDEASQTTESTGAAVLYKQKDLDLLILRGEVKQLPPVVTSAPGADPYANLLRVSIMERWARANPGLEAVQHRHETERQVVPPDKRGLLRPRSAGASFGQNSTCSSWLASLLLRSLAAQP